MTIREFLANIGLEQYIESFEENGIEMDILPELEESDLPDLGVKLLGHRKKLMKAIRLQGPGSKAIAAGKAPAPPPTPKPAPSPRKLAGDTEPDAPIMAPPVAKTPPAPAQPKPAAPAPQKVKRRISRTDMVATIVEQATVSDPASATVPSGRPVVQPTDPSATGKRRSAQRIKRLKRSSIDRIPAATDPNAAPAPKRAEPAAKAPTQRKKKQSGFSETQWFMAGAKEDADLLEAKVENLDYDHDKDISEDERKPFTLREDED